jgi:hypothetical protein
MDVFGWPRDSRVVALVSGRDLDPDDREAVDLPAVAVCAFDIGSGDRVECLAVGIDHGDRLAVDIARCRRVVPFRSVASSKASSTSSSRVMAHT